METQRNKMKLETKNYSRNIFGIILYVTIEGAKAYGVIANFKGDVDASGTKALRTQMRAERPPLELFNYGPPMETLRANCFAETGLAAPVQPIWATLEAAE